MFSQIFKYKMPLELLCDLLDNISKRSTNNKYYIVDNNSYKKGIFNENITSFVEKCKAYYHVSKHIYLDRKMSYNNFMTILRQVCKFNNILYTSNIIYDKSKYTIIYYVYLPDIHSTNV